MQELPNKRSRKILSVLLKSEKSVIINDLASYFNVSGRTIRNDLNKLEEWLENRSINLVKKPGVGVWVEVDSQKRKILLEKFSQLEDYKDAVSPKKRKEFILKYLLYQHQQYTMQDIADKLFVSRSTIYKDLEEIEDWLSKYDLQLERRQNYGIYVKGDEKNWRKAVADLLVKLKNNQELKSMLEEELNNDFKGEDDIYEQLQELFGEINFKEIEKIITEVEFESAFLFTDEAVTALVVHIAIALERLKKDRDIKMSDDQLNVLKDKKEYQIAAKIADRIEAKWSYKIPEAEIGYIALYLGAAVERITQSWKVIIVCSSGVGTSQLLASKIKRYLPQIEIVEILSTHELDNKELENVDLIISTIPLSNTKKDVITVSPILTESDLSRIKEKINYLSQADKNKFSNSMSPASELKSLFEPELIFVNLDLKDPEKVIKFLGARLKERGFVDQEFIDSVLKREKITATEVGKGLAIPHARIKEIKQRKVAAAVLKEAIEWGEEKVKIVFLLAIDNQIARKFFSYFYQIMEDDLRLNQIKEAKSKEKIISLLTNRGL